MKTVVFVAGRDPLGPAAGDSVYLRAHARAARQAGFEPHIFCTAPKAGVRDAPFGRVHLVRSSVLPLPAPRGVGFRKSFIFWHAPLLAASIRRFLAGAEGPHLVHGFSSWSCVGPMVARTFRRHRIPVGTIASFYTTARHESDGKLQGITAAHGWFPRLQYRAENLVIRRVVERYERLGYLGADLATVNYETVRRLLEVAYGSRSGVRRLAYCSESAFFPGDGDTGAGPSAPCGTGAADVPLVVSVSRHDARKGVDVFLRALADLRGAGVSVRACLVSGGELLGAHRALATRLGLPDTVRLVGAVPDPASYLRQADIFVLPSIQEASGSLALLEALQAGVAVVASAVDGVVEDVVDGESALLVRPGDQAALAAALRRLLANPDLRRHLAERGREIFRLRFSAGGLVRALAETYADLGLPGEPRD